MNLKSQINALKINFKFTENNIFKTQEISVLLPHLIES